MLYGAIIGGFIGLVVWAIGIAKASYATAGQRVPGANTSTSFIETHLPPDEVLQRLRQIDPATGYKVDPTLAGPNSICIATSPDLKSYGWFYPIQVLPSGTGSRVSIGIVPRHGPGGLPTKKFHAIGVEYVKNLLK